MKIENYKESHHDQKVYATFDVDLQNGVTYPNIKLRRGKNNKLFIDRPSYVKSDDGMGNKTWGKYPELSKEREIDFNAKVKIALEPFAQF